MTSDAPTAELPPLYARWLSDALGGPIAAETEATCHDCAMISPEILERAERAANRSEQGRAEDGAFDPTTKCCTYLPSLANFLVGGLLLDPEADPVGRASVVARIEAGIGVTPLGLERTPQFDALYHHGAKRLFGRSRALRCPHYLEDGRCGVWRHREATCATWFCKHVRGAAGQRFWREALHPLLASVERDLSRWCIAELGLDTAALIRLLATQRTTPRETLNDRALDGARDDEVQRSLWGEWLGRELELYERAAKLVAPLAWSDVLRICGPDVRLYSMAAEHVHRTLEASELPEFLELGTFTIVAASPLSLRVATYSEYDPVELPRSVFDALGCFDGRSTRDAISAAEEEHGIEIDEPLIEQLVDFGLLNVRTPR